MKCVVEQLNHSAAGAPVPPPSPNLPRRGNGYVGLYESGAMNRCPGCGNSNWYVGRATAECAFCRTAVPLADMSCLAIPLHETQSAAQARPPAKCSISMDATSETSDTSAATRRFTASPVHRGQASDIEKHRERDSEAEDLADESIYFSRRAHEEEIAARNATCGRTRSLHMELAQAYEFRAHLLTQELLRRDRSRLSAH